MHPSLVRTASIIIPWVFGGLRLHYIKSSLWLDNAKTITVVMKQTSTHNLHFLCLRKLQLFPILKYKSNSPPHVHKKQSHTIPLIFLLKVSPNPPLAYDKKFKILNKISWSYLSNLSQPKWPGSLCSSHTNLFWLLQWNVLPLISGTTYVPPFPPGQCLGQLMLSIKPPFKCHS